MEKRSRYSPEVRERAARAVIDEEREYDSQKQAIYSKTEKYGCSPQTLRKWVRRAEVDFGKHVGTTADEREQIRQSERDNRELKGADEISRKASVYCAQVRLDCRNHSISSDNASKVLWAFEQFGMNDPSLTAETLQQPGKIIRMGVPPVRIEVLTEIDGVVYSECYKSCECTTVDEVPVTLISRKHLLQNKNASGRYKDLDDVEQLGRA